MLQGVSLIYLRGISKAKNCWVRDERICFSSLLDLFACWSGRRYDGLKTTRPWGLQLFSILLERSVSFSGYASTPDFPPLGSEPGCNEQFRLENPSRNWSTVSAAGGRGLVPGPRPSRSRGDDAERRVLSHVGCSSSSAVGATPAALPRGRSLWWFRGS